MRLAGPTAIDVRANDSGGPNEAGDSYLITSVREGSRGIVTITGGGTGLTYDPMGCATGSDTFSYILTDSGGQTDSATVLGASPAPARTRSRTGRARSSSPTARSDPRCR
ncbi:MAG: hypothetical protein A2V85_03325 [Chloroflexi bacterium RBG_16_72_14]|nr:MAG: hypothetical protein A2V85_03325 [Chloroflexi bacterium RBG_16_72_14]